MSLFFKQIFRQLPFYFILSIWIIKLVETLTPLSLVWLGNHPRHWNEWFTIFSGAFIHSDFQHLANNTYVLAVTGVFIYFLFERYSWIVFLSSYFLSGLLLFLFARANTYHIGASGVAYSWATLLAASGFFRKDRLSLGLGLLVALLYGSMIWGIFPIEKGVSWDGHLYGAISGIFVAYSFRNLNIQKAEKKQTPKLEDYQFEHYQYGNFSYIKRQKPIETPQTIDIELKQLKNEVDLDSNSSFK